MKKFMATILTILMAATVLIACGKADPVADDLVNYINKQVQPIVSTEKTINSDYASVAGSNYKDDATLGAKLKDSIIPASDDALAKATALAPATDEVKKLNSEYVAVITAQNEAFKLCLDGVTKGDATQVTAANGKLADANTAMTQFNTDLAALKKDHNVTDSK